jgi:hypothetical protein
VPRDDTAHNSEFEQESSRLAEGLKNCRTVVKNYRAMMANEPLIALEQGPAEETDAAVGS